MSSDAIQIKNIDINQPFVEQQYIQLFLGNPSLVEDSYLVDNELLYKFLLIAHKALEEEITRCSLKRAMNGIKFGYERKVLMPNDTCRVDSQFVADQKWRIEFEEKTIGQVQFLSAEVRNLEEIETIDDPLKYYLIDLNELCSNELYRIYPKLPDCLEIHVYVLVNFEEEQSASIDNDCRELNLLSNIDDGDMPGQTTLASHDCPGCWEGTGENRKKNPNKKGPEGNCRPCTNIHA